MLSDNLQQTGSNYLKIEASGSQSENNITIGSWCVGYGGEEERGEMGKDDGSYREANREGIEDRGGSATASCWDKQS